MVCYRGGLQYARHSVIAEMVSRIFCKSDLEKYNYIEKVLTNSIPSNPLEKSLIKKLYHNTTIANMFSECSIGEKTYDLLSQQFPADPFLFQQKAMFHAINGQFDEAKNTIEIALKINPTSHILTNTKGTLLLKEALSEDDKAISSYLRDQGKEILENAIRRSNIKSPYHYHSLASHLINWYKKFSDSFKEGEGEELLEQIQRVLEDGNKEYPNDSSLISEVGRLNSIKLNEPEAKKHFIKAINLNPRNMSARFLLSKILLNEGKLNEALKYCTEGVLLKEDEVLLNRIRFEIMHKLDMIPETIIAEYVKYLTFSEQDFYIKLCYGAFLYIIGNDMCTDIFSDLRINSYLSKIEKRHNYNIEKTLNIDYFTDIGYVDRITPVGYLLRSERFSTRTLFYCHNNLVKKRLKDKTRLECNIKFNHLGAYAVTAKVLL